jgi:hypothetical protein
MVIPVFFGYEGLIWVDTLDQNEPFTQNHIIGLPLSDLKERAQNLRMW